MMLELTSPAFRDGETIPEQYTSNGRNISPTLKWSDPPEGARSFALICEDPDAPRGSFAHWLVFDLPAESRELSEGFPAEAKSPNGTTQGTNDFGKVGYIGPAPPRGKPHRYCFKLFALDRRLNLRAGATKAQLLATMKGHVLAEGELLGTYAR